MKGLLFLGLVGAAIYGALVLSYDVLSRDTAKDALVGQSLGSPGDRQLRSWGTDLPALTGSNSQAAALPLRTPGVTPASTSAASLSMGEAKPASAQYDGNTYQPAEWAKVVFAAKVHGDASISSPTLRFYQPGTTLQVISRQNGWVQVTDPPSGQGGWVFEQYLAPAEGPTVTRTAMETTASNSAAEATRAIPTVKKRVRASRPAARKPDSFASAQLDSRWERRAERRGGFGLFFFGGRFARAE
jgi:Bacterial SH3 domain